MLRRSLLPSLVLGLSVALIPGLFPDPTCASTDRALLIGIQSYSALGDGWWNLDGPLNDLELVREILIGRLGFPSENVRVLRDLEATRRAILSEMERLERNAGAGDRIYVHYSGHGSRVDDANGDEGDRRKDSTLVPIDGGADGDFQILDDEIRIWLDRLLRKTPHVILVVDACHSGTITRDPRSLRVRGVSWSDPRSYAWSDTLRDGLRRAASDPPTDGRLILASACRDDQEAREHETPDGTIFGLLTWAWCSALAEAQSEDTFQDIFHAAESRMYRASGRIQEPQLEGSAGAYVFPDGRVAPSPPGPGLRLASLLPAFGTAYSSRPWRISVLAPDDSRTLAEELAVEMMIPGRARPSGAGERRDLLLLITSSESGSNCRFLDGSERAWGGGRVKSSLLSVSLEAPEDIRTIRHITSRLWENEYLMRLTDEYQNALPGASAVLNESSINLEDECGPGAIRLPEHPGYYCPRSRVSGITSAESWQAAAGRTVFFSIDNTYDQPLYVYVANLAPDGSLSTFGDAHSGFQVPARGSLLLDRVKFQLKEEDVGLIDTYFCFLSEFPMPGWQVTWGALPRTGDISTRSPESTAKVAALDAFFAPSLSGVRGGGPREPRFAVRRFSILVTK